MAQVAQHPPGLTATNWHPDPDKENQDLLITKTVKKMKNQTMDSLRDDVHEGKVPEYDIAGPDDPEPQVQTEEADQEHAEPVKECPCTSGPVLGMPGVADLPTLEDINAQFLNHSAYYDVAIPSQQKQCLAMKNCPHPTPFRRHKRNQHGFTIHCANCNCRLLFAKKYEVTKTADGRYQLSQRIHLSKSLETVAGTALQKKFAVKSLQQLADQHNIQNALQLALLQRAIQTEHPIYTASRPAHGLSQEFLVKQMNNLAFTMIQQIQETVGSLAATMAQQMQIVKRSFCCLSLSAVVCLTCLH